MLRRSRFIALSAGVLLVPAAARAAQQDDIDPAMSSGAPALRVLLGAGDAQNGPGGTFLFNGQPYRGTYQRLDDGRIVNVVDVEQYLYSVVTREMPPAWPPEALQAQAVCARTYVLQRSNPRRAYDLVPSEADQVYRGASGETAGGRQAVDATAGSVLRYNNAYASVAYSSCCGGHTEANSDAWGGVALPYLAGVPCSYCTQSPNYRWTTMLGVDSIASAFSEQLAPYGDLTDVRIGPRDASGRARAFELVGRNGSTFVKGTTFRLGVGARVLRSLLVTDLRVTQPALVVEGGGLGHGVGLCQWGARGMALAGHSARDILTLYFPGTQLAHD